MILKNNLFVMSCLKHLKQYYISLISIVDSPPRKIKKICRVCNAIVDRSYSSYFKESAPKHFLKVCVVKTVIPV